MIDAGAQVQLSSNYTIQSLFYEPWVTGHRIHKASGPREIPTSAVSPLFRLYFRFKVWKIQEGHFTVNGTYGTGTQATHVHRLYSILCR